MKMMITGRRRADQTWTEMKNHMLNVHGPLVIQEAGGFLHRYVQNHVRDGAYGLDAPYGRDMVAELTMPDTPRPGGGASKAVHDDEANFAHLTDRFFMPTEETVILAPPLPPSRTEPSRAGKTLHYLKRPVDQSPEAFAAAWAALDGQATTIAGVKGYVRSTPLAPPGAPPPPYDGVSSLWFDPADAAAGLQAWTALIARLIDSSHSFMLHVDEHEIIAAV